VTRTKTKIRSKKVNPKPNPKSDRIQIKTKSKLPKWIYTKMDMHLIMQQNRYASSGLSKLNFQNILCCI